MKPNKEDDKNFNYLMENNFEEIDNNSLIYQNYKYFLERINKLDASIDVFYDALQRLEGVSVTLDKEDDAQMIFESLNSTGMDLNDVDLIRNYLLMNCPPSEQDKLYLNYWLKLEEKLGKSFTEFVRDYLSFKNGLVVQSGKNKVYTAFKKYYTNNYYDKGIDLEEFLQDWMKYAKAYSMLLKPNLNSEKNQLNNALNDTINLNMKTTFPFLLGILHDTNEGLISTEDTIKILRLIESYSVRRSICSIQGGALSQAMASLYKEVKDKYKDDFYNECYVKIATKLVSINTNAYFPKDGQFGDEFTTRDMYSSPLRRYILDKLENSYQNKEVVNLENLTIEHIMPNTITDEWKRYLNMDNVEEFHEQYKNRIGNLTLTAYNSEMGQKLFDEKKNNSDFSRLCLNKYFENVQFWNKYEIEKRGKQLFNDALKIWPFPEVFPEKGLSLESYNILEENDDFDLSNTRPTKYIFNENYEKHVNSWNTFYQSILDDLYNVNKELFLSIMSQDNYCGAIKKMISKNESDLRNGELISDGYYIETNNNTMRKIKILKTLIMDMGIDVSSIVVYIVPA